MDEQIKLTYWVLKKNKRILPNLARRLMGLTATAVILFYGQEHGGYNEKDEYV